MNRSKNFDEDLSERLKKPKFARQFLAGLMEGEDGLSVEDAIRETISRMGIKEFSKMTGFPSSNIVDFVKGRRTPKPETLNSYLKPFQLKVRLILAKAS